METFDIIHSSNGLEIHGIPDAKVLVELDDHRALRVAHLSLHLFDLEFADQCLDEIPKNELYSVLQQALWRAAIVYFFKSFGNSKARTSLSAIKIFKGDAEGLDLFNGLKSLRDKHLVHDENPYSQCLPTAALNDGKKAHKVEKVVTVGFVGDTLTKEDYSNLKLLLKKTKNWVELEYHRLCDEISAELEKIPYEDLIKLPAPKFSKPQEGDIHRTR